MFTLKIPLPLPSSVSMEFSSANQSGTKWALDPRDLCIVVWNTTIIKYISFITLIPNSSSLPKLIPTLEFSSPSVYPDPCAETFEPIPVSPQDLLWPPHSSWPFTALNHLTFIVVIINTRLYAISNRLLITLFVHRSLHSNQMLSPFKTERGLRVPSGFPSLEHNYLVDTEWEIGRGVEDACYHQTDSGYWAAVCGPTWKCFLIAFGQ